jgi:phosphonoacetaldehyde hydrolase
MKFLFYRVCVCTRRAAGINKVFNTPLRILQNSGTTNQNMSTHINTYRMVPVYHGRVQACIFDWAGTVCDAGVFAPVLSFQKLFEAEGVPITDAETRAPMGVHKRVHISEICKTPSVTQRWLSKKGKAPSEADIDRIYNKYLTTTEDVLSNNSSLITGTPETMAVLRNELGVKIGSTTGYTTEIMAKLRPIAAAEGYSPDCYVTSSDVPVARPSPSMIFLNMVKLDIWNTKCVVKVDDSAAGIVAGLHAGCWTVGIAKTGNYVGLTEEAMTKMNPLELSQKVDSARKSLYKAGCHFVIDTIKDLPPVVEEINRRLAMGINP